MGEFGYFPIFNAKNPAKAGWLQSICMLGLQMCRGNISNPERVKLEGKPVATLVPADDALYRDL